MTGGQNAAGRISESLEEKTQRLAKEAEYKHSMEEELEKLREKIAKLSDDFYSDRRSKGVELTR
jgi:predicted RNase H-like nuclease (RuvC/YqgF family)